MWGGSIVQGPDRGGPHDSEAAILFIGREGQSREIAVERSRAEDGKRYGPGFGLPQSPIPRAALCFRL